MKFAIGLIIGLLIGLLMIYFPLKKDIARRKPIGNLRVDQSDPSDAPYLFLELDAGTNVNTIIRSKYVTLRVKVEDFIPHN